MPKRTHNQNTLALGQWNADCDVCGFKFKSDDLQERWDGLMVCADDWEQRHPSDFFRARQEDTSVPWNRPTEAQSAPTCASVFADVGTAVAGCAVVGNGSPL